MCLTFLIVDDKVALLIPCGDLIGDAIPIRVLSQYCCNKCVGACIF